MTNALGQVTLYFYNYNLQQTKMMLADGSTISNYYNLLGQLISVVDGAGNWVTNHYNNQGAALPLGSGLLSPWGRPRLFIMQLTSWYPIGVASIHYAIDFSGFGLGLKARWRDLCEWTGLEGGIM